MDNFNVSQSPYSEAFEAGLDTGIKNLVLGLRNKGYLTCYSCEGHSNSKPRYVILAFGSQEAREKLLINLLRGLPSWLFPSERLETLATETYEGTVYTHQSIEEETRGFNFLFLRNFERYWFLKINVGMAVYNDNPMSSYLGHFRFNSRLLVASVFNFFFRERLTQLIINRVSRLEHSPL